ncbi:MAG: enoyl-CoA hydratase [Rhizobacter sp.]|nr:enoyl-CoA hydratase [Rhizobacter sp.]
MTQINQYIRFDREGDIGVLTFANPSKLNPLTHEFQHGTREVLAMVKGDPSVRALVVTGEGKAFCVGADLSGVPPASGADAEKSLGNRMADSMHAVANKLILELQSLPVPVVSAVNGPAAGAGVGIALAADVVVAAKSAYFYLPFMPKLGIVPDLGTTWFLERIVGRSRAVAMSLLNERLSAEQAQQWGLVWSVVDDAELMSAALSIAARLAALPSHAAIEIRHAYDAAGTHTLEQQVAYEAERQRELLDKPSFRQGVEAFQAKRNPVFSPRS